MMAAALMLIPIAAGIITVGGIVLLFPLLRRYALARPNARSSHRIPTPQGGGIAVLIAVIIVLATAMMMMPQNFTDPSRLVVVLAAALALAMVGAVDDIRPIEPMPRLALQAVAVIVVIAALPWGFRVVPMLPWWMERALMAVGLLWFVNLVNFMDGIDLITVAEIVPVTAALGLFGWYQALPADSTIAAATLCGAMLGFAPFNKPVARLFLGDVGSLSTALLLGWLLILLAEQHLVAALLLPLYYIADSSITLFRRILRGDSITQAHRSHFYQQAIDSGMSVYAVVGRIFGINVLLVALALSTLTTAIGAQILAILCGVGAVATLLITFSRAKSP
jgi:UDP-N-acetylmuramyl pentapeptide phosphotransferase/UDP-N-acetylglucosamine-1-phosphate transferase